MRAITNITIQQNTRRNRTTMFLTYNNNESDYSSSTHETVSEALSMLSKNNPYYPIKTNGYHFLEFAGVRIIQDKQILL